MKIQELKIKDIVLPGNVLLAPLAGVTDVGFRKVCRASGAHLSFTEMVSVKGLHYKNSNTARLLKCADNELPRAVQLFGSEPDLFYSVILSGVLDDFDIIDINMGCPVPKVVNNGEGSALMTNISLAEKVIKACVKATDRAVTVKFRKGFDGDNINAVEFAKMCQDSGAALITVHGRLRSQYYSGVSDRDIIAAVKGAVSIPVIANGDIFSVKDAHDIIESTGADGIMIARGCLGNPQVFSHITGNAPLTVREAIMMHAEELLSRTDEAFTVLNMRKHILWYLSRISGGKQLKPRAGKLAAFAELAEFVSEVF